MATKLKNIKITEWNNYTFTYNKRNKLRTIYINGKRIKVIGHRHLIFRHLQLVILDMMEQMQLKHLYMILEYTVKI